MPGSIRKRGKQSWELRIERGRDLETGRRLFRYEYVRGTKREAEQVLTDLLHKRDTGTDIAPAKVTVAEYLDRWLIDYAQANVGASTLVRYRGFVKRLKPFLGRRKLQDLRPAMIQQAYGSLLADDLAPRTVLHHHRMLRLALKHAVQWQLLSANPADAVIPPRPQRTEMRSLDAGDVHWLINQCEDEQMRVLIFTAVSTGMRLGELLGLRWSDLTLDPSNGTAHVARTVRYLSAVEGVTFGTPKTAKSRRTVALSAENVRVLREHRTRQPEARLALGEAYEGQDLVFPGPTGKPVRPSNVSHRFRTLVKRAGLEPLRFHDLRHTAASLMLRAEVHPKVVSERLGHSTISITLDQYSHVIPSIQREAAAALDNVLAVGR